MAGNERMVWAISEEKVLARLKRADCDKRYGDKKYPLPDDLNEAEARKICERICEELKDLVERYSSVIIDWEDSPKKYCAEDLEKAHLELCAFKYAEADSWIFCYNPYKLTVGINDGEIKSLIYRIEHLRMEFERMEDNFDLVIRRLEGSGKLQKNRKRHIATIEESMQEAADAS